MAPEMHDSSLSRWQTAAAARSARITTSGSWHGTDSDSGSPSSLRSPRSIAAFFYPSRLLLGARIRRLLLVFMTAVFLTVCFLRLSQPTYEPATGNSNTNTNTNANANADSDSDNNQLHVIHGGIRKLSWASMTQPPVVDVGGPKKGPTEGEKPLAASDGVAVPQSPPVVVPGTVTTEVCVSFPEILGVDPGKSTMVAHIPPKIWQIYLDFTEKSLSKTCLVTWLFKSPSFAYTVLDAAGALSLVGRLVDMASSGAWRVSLYSARNAIDAQTRQAQISSLDFARDALQQYAAMPRRVLRADFMRYLVLALEGGVYSDTDTSLVKPIRDWVPSKYRDSVKLIVGLEADSSPPVTGTTYEVQFCQWTLASAPDHPTMWTMLDRILIKLRAKQGQKTGLEEADPAEGNADNDNASDKQADGNAIVKRGYAMSDKDVLGITGPAAWTEVVFEHLNAVAGDGAGNDRITWKTLAGMKEPRLYGDTLVLPIDGFATGVPHSKASTSKSSQTLILHQFQGKWKDDRG